jgi:acetyl esterase/lipase
VTRSVGPTGKTIGALDYRALACAPRWREARGVKTFPRGLALLGFMFGAANAARATEVRRDIEYGRAGGEALLLDAGIPDGPGPFPVAILVHGGGWTRGDKAGSDRPGDGADIAPWFNLLNRANYVWFSINYRLAPKHRWPACLEDLQTAVRWVKANAAGFRGDAGRIAVFGHSAGGHLALMLATISKPDTRVQAVAGFAAVADHEHKLAARGGLGDGLQALLGRPKEITPEALHELRAISPINRVKAGMPPVLLLHGDADKTVAIEQSVAFQRRVKAAGGICDLITLPGAPHGLREWAKASPDHESHLLAWLDRTFAAAGGVK